MPRLYRGVEYTAEMDSVKIPDLTIKPSKQQLEQQQQELEEQQLAEQTNSELQQQVVEPVAEPEPIELTEQELKELFKQEFDQLYKQEEQKLEQQKQQAIETAVKQEVEKAVKIAVEQATAEASERAYENSFAKRQQELSKSLEHIDNTLQQIQICHREFLEKHAVELKYLAVDIAEKFILNKINENDELLKKLVLEAVVEVKNSSWLNIELSSSLSTLIDSIKEELDVKGYKGRTTVTTKLDDTGLIRVTGEESTVDAGIAAQAENLRDLFEQYDKGIKSNL